MLKEQLIIGAIAGDIIGSVYEFNNFNTTAGYSRRIT
jgi:hypothetical protein